MNLIVEDDLIPNWRKIEEKSLFAQTQIPCPNRDLTEIESGLTAGWCDDRQTAVSVTIHEPHTNLPTGAQFLVS